MIPNVTVCRWSSQYLFHTLLALVNLPTGRFLVILLSYGSYLTPLNQATGYAIQHDSVPVPSQDKLGGLRQEGHLAIKMGGLWWWGRRSLVGVASTWTVGASAFIIFPCSTKSRKF